MSRRRKSPRRMPRAATEKPADGVPAIATCDVPDPYVMGSTARVKRRLSPVRLMLSRREISEGHVRACEAFLAVVEAAEFGGAKAIDYTREPVDGGSVAQPLSPSALAAGRELVTIARLVGKIGYDLLTRIVVMEHGVSQVALTWPCPGDRKRREGYVKGRLVEAADCLVDHFGMLAEGKPRVRARASAEGHTGPVREWGVGRFGDLVEVER